MTTKTDTAALMLKMRNLADRIIDAEGENNNGEVGKIIEMYDAADTTFKAQNILLVLDAFEAEHHRADHNKVMQLAAEDVSASALRDWSSEGIKLHAALDQLEAAEARVKELEQQNPCAAISKIKHWREAPCNGVDWAKGWKEGWNACIKKIEAAGGSVRNPQ